MAVLRNDIAAFERVRPELEAEHRGEWAVFHRGTFAGVYPDFEQAAAMAVESFGSGPYLIRQIGVDAVQLSSTLVFRPSHARSPGGV